MLRDYVIMLVIIWLCVLGLLLLSSGIVIIIRCQCEYNSQHFNECATNLLRRVNVSHLHVANSEHLKNRLDQVFH